jgi:uncharacterized Zn-binding protein involved in type VI secretion
VAVASGGTAIPAMMAVGAVATGAAVGGGVGQLIGSENMVVKGAINKAATTVFINSRATPAARSCIDTALCQDHTLQLIATGSINVFVEKFPAARISDTGACSFKISQGSPNVFIGEATGQCAGIDIKPEVEPWLQWTHRATGWIGGLCLLGPAYGLRVAVASMIGGEIGAHFGGQIGEHFGGKWGGVAGSILGGVIGGGIPLRPSVRGFINGQPRGATFGSSTSTNYRETFFEANPETRGNVVVHHAVEQQAMRRYPGVISESQMHSLENLRGIPKPINSDVHLSQIRRSWNEFYRNNPNPTQQQLLDHATRIDDQFGHLFDPPIR